MIYLDHNSTTPLAAEAAAAMNAWQSANFGNPASQHQLGRRARQALEDAREGIAKILGARTSDRQRDSVVFTSGGTEANNLALFGLARLHDPSTTPGEAIVSAIEHPSIAAPVESLERRGWRIHRLGVSRAGVVDVEQLDKWLTANTRFVSVMLANNETGVIQPVAEIAERCARLNVPLHTDASQIVGKLPVNFRALGAGAMTLAAHKFHGPVGTGALVVRHGLELEPLLRGGFQQAGLRPGTEPVALAVGLHAALEAWHVEGPARVARLQRLRDRLEAGLAAHCAGEIVVHGAASDRLPNTSNLAFVGLDRQALLMALDQAGVACSTGSACASGSSEPSQVLVAMGCPKALLQGSLRFSLGATTTVEEIDEAITRIAGACLRLAAVRPASRAAAR